MNAPFPRSLAQVGAIPSPIQMPIELSPARSLVLPKVSFVVPTLNEAKNLPWLLPRIPDWAHEVVIVDGRSTDDTVAVARRLRKDVKIVMEPKRGKGAALQAGFNAATGDIIVMLDADGSMEPEEAIVFVGVLMAGADMVKGSRFLQGAGMGLVVVPLTMVAYATLPSAVRTDATAVFAMTRNLSASVAIAAMGALFAHNAQMIHAEVSTHVTEMNLPILDGRLIQQLGHAGGMVAAMVDAEVNRQALMIAYIDDFWLMMWGAAAAMPFVLMLRPKRPGKAPVPAPAE